MSLTRLFIAIVSLGAAARAHDVISTKITWSREISRIVYKRCVSCHQEGGSAFSLVKYEEARPWATAIKEEVLGRRMPPWNAVKGFGDFQDDAGLTQEQISLIGNWVEGGAPEGDPLYLPKKPRLPDAVEKSDAPGTPVRVTGSLTLSAAASFVAIQPGKLKPGETIQVTAMRPDGTVEPLIWVEGFNPTYAEPYRFAQPVRLPAGSRILVNAASSRTVVLYRERSTS